MLRLPAASIRLCLLLALAAVPARAAVESPETTVKINDRIPLADPDSGLARDLEAPDAVSLKTTVNADKLAITLHDAIAAEITYARPCEANFDITYVGPLSPLLDHIKTACGFQSWTATTPRKITFNDPPPVETVRPASAPPRTPTSNTSTPAGPPTSLLPADKSVSPPTAATKAAPAPSTVSTISKRPTAKATPTAFSTATTAVAAPIAPPAATPTPNPDIARTTLPASGQAIPMPANQAAAAEIAGVEQNLATDRFARKADIRHWTIKKGRPLSETIAQWCAQAKYNEPVYLSTNDPVADADFTFEGDLISALGQIADALSNLPDEHIPYIYVSPASKLVQISDVPQPTAAQINLRKTEK